MKKLALKARVERRRKIAIVFLALLVCSAIAGTAWLYNSIHSWYWSGVVAYDSSVTDAEREQLEGILGKHNLRYDVMISARTVTELPSEAHFVLSTKVPVVTFYDARQSIGRAELFGPEGEAVAYQAQLVAVRDLDVTRKVLAIDDDYFFRDMRRGAVFRVLELDSKNPNEVIAILDEELEGGLEASDIFSVAQTGTTGQEPEWQDSQVVRLAYNPADEQETRAEISEAKASGAWVMVEIDYEACRAGQECDAPVGGQRELFRKVAAMGADMVVGLGVQAQTFEIYKGVPIFYGLGNLESGAVRSLGLTHYFYRGRLLATQVRPMGESAGSELLERLGRARPADADRLEIRTVQGLVDEWARGRNVGVLIRSLDTGQMVAQVNPERKFFAASLYKLAVVTAGYLRVQGGQNPNATLLGGRTWGQCLDVSIRTSDNPCAETLWTQLGRDTATMSMSAADSVRELERVWQGELSIMNRALYLDSLLEQEVLFRRGLPAGFAGDVRVYNKVGWLAAEWHDAAIVAIDGRYYAVAVLTQGVGHTAVRELGSLLNLHLRRAVEL